MIVQHSIPKFIFSGLSISDNPQKNIIQKRLSKKHRYQQLQNKRAKRQLKRKQENKLYRKSPDSVANKSTAFRIKSDQNLIAARWRKFPLYAFLAQKKFVRSNDPEPYIVIPKDFRLNGSNYGQTMYTIGEIAESIFSADINCTDIDFSQCFYTDPATLFLLQVLRLEFLARARTFNKNLNHILISTKNTVVKSKDREVNRLLFIAGLLPELEVDPQSDMIPISTTGYLTGTKQQKHYEENRKGKVTTQVVGYVNECLAEHGCVLTSDGKNDMDGLISELLNNAEDHSPFNSWYISANFCRRTDPLNDDVIGEFNLSVLNFGYSFYEGFEETKAVNHELYNALDRHVTELINNHPLPHCTRENLFTLAALQENISRLRYERESRGYGSMRFIRAMFDIGDYEDVTKNFAPKLTLLTGATQLICDNKFKPFNKDNVYHVSLNPQNDLTYPPEASHLQSLRQRFPGTLLSVRLFLNEQHLISKFNGNGNGHESD